MAKRIRNKFYRLHLLKSQRGIFYLETINTNKIIDEIIEQFLNKNMHIFSNKPIFNYSNAAVIDVNRAEFTIGDLILQIELAYESKSDMIFDCTNIFTQQNIRILKYVFAQAPVRIFILNDNAQYFGGQIKATSLLTFKKILI